MSITIDKIHFNNNPIDYVADDKLVKAIEIAIALGKPLVISGEPGTGKTKLADYVAKQLAIQTQENEYGFLESPFVFNTKSTSISTDLFYFYDAVSHFRSQQAGVRTEQFIELRPLGLAIAQTHGLGSQTLESLYGLSNFNEKHLIAKPRSSVVLIDEIDKAPREFPNDLLNEVEKYSFEIRELNKSITRADNDCRILLIITSNSEKNLPNAFLRRCVFHHIEFPDQAKLLQIVKKRLTINDSAYDVLLEKAIKEFNIIRNKAVNKKPSTSEFLDWICILQQYGLLKEHTFSDNGKSESEYELYESTKSTLIKNYEDQMAVSR